MRPTATIFMHAAGQCQLPFVREALKIGVIHAGIAIDTSPHVHISHALLIWTEVSRRPCVNERRDDDSCGNNERGLYLFRHRALA